VQTTTAAKVAVELDAKQPYELDGGDRPKTRRLKFRVEPAAISVCLPEKERR
jgi:diacylglycerol kinase family enzyme